MKYLKLFKENLDFDNFDWEENYVNIEEVRRFENEFNKMINEFLMQFNDGAGDQLAEPTNELVAEQMDEILRDFDFTINDIKAIIERNKGERYNNINDYIDLFYWYLDPDNLQSI